MSSRVKKSKTNMFQRYQIECSGNSIHSEKFKCLEWYGSMAIHMKIEHNLLQNGAFQVLSDSEWGVTESKLSDRAPTGWHNAYFGSKILSLCWPSPIFYIIFVFSVLLLYSSAKDNLSEFGK